MAMVLCLLALGALVPNRLWMGQLASSVAWQCSLVALAVVVLGLIARSRVGVVLALIAGAGLASVPLLGARADRLGATDPQRPSLRLLLINAYALNEVPDLLLDAMDQVDADVIILTEPPPELLRSFMQRESDATLRAKPTRGEHSWLVVRSGFAATPVGEAGDGLLMCRIDGPWGTLDLVACHLLSPRTPGRFAESKRQVDRMVGWVRAQHGSDGALVIAGDLNATPGSQTSRRLASETQTRRTAPRFSVGTYPAGQPALLRLGIDDALVSSQIKVIRWGRIGLPGSDHEGVVIDLSLPPEAGESAAANNPHSSAYEADQQSEDGTGSQE